MIRLGVFLVFLSTVAFGAPIPPGTSVPMQASPGTAVALQINLARLNAGLSELAFDDQFVCASSLQAAFLAQVTNVCAHEGLSESSLEHRVELCGGAKVAAEVSACGYPSEIGAVADWLKSSRHYKIIMDPKLKRVGGAMLNKQWVVVLGF